MQNYNISVGLSRTSTDWKRTSMTWDRLLRRLSDFRRTGETLAEYQAMTRAEQAKAKDVGGFVGGTLSGPQRKACNVQRRSLVTLDIDYAEAGTPDDVALCLVGHAWCLYSTHSHTGAKPRYRLILPLSREVEPDEYLPIARRVAEWVGMDIFDDSTYQAERLMYWPSCSRDAEPVFLHAGGDPVDADSVLSSYADWRNVMEWPCSSRVTAAAGQKNRRQEDPTLKEGLIGNFCRAYTVSEAIEEYLPGVYVPTGSPGRYTYAGGTTEGGAVVYEDKWLYSHHGTDPCCEREVNAFDLVRIHLFGDEDLEVNPDTPQAKRPSFVRMRELAGKDRKVRAVRSEGVKASIEADFGHLGLRPDSEQGESAPDWLGELEWNERKGKPRELANTPRNFRLVLENHPAFKDAFIMDEFEHSRILTRDVLRHRVEDGRYYTDADDRNLIQFFADAPYYTQGKQNIIDTALYVAECRGVHPVREYLRGLEWDGVPRLDTLISDYLGSVDCELDRVMTRKHFCAACRRIFEPGCKHDGVLSLDGPQGIGKSTLIRIMGGKWFSDTSINVDKANETGLHLQGVWIKELAELTDYKKSTVEQYKNFISSTEDRVRIPYDRSYQTFPRQCVIFASTNDSNFLKGDTGNRRFWIIPVGVVKPKKNVWRDLPGERDQIWAEAMARYPDETSELPPLLEQELYERQKGHNEMAEDLRIDLIRNFMLERVPKGWANMSKAQRKEWQDHRTLGGFAVADSDLEKRPPVCYAEVAVECLGLKLDMYTKRTVKGLLQYVGATQIGARRDDIYGQQRRWELNE